MRVASLRKKTPIVGDEQNRAAVAQQELFQPADGLDVEVVGRLVEQQDVRDCGPGPGPAARGVSCRPRVRPRRRRHRATSAKGPPRPPGASASRRRFPGRAGRDRAAACNSALPSTANWCATRWYSASSFGTGPQPAGDLVENRARESLGHFLGEHGRDEPLLPGDFALRSARFRPESAARAWSCPFRCGPAGRPARRAQAEG